MKPADKLKLVRHRGLIIKSLDVTTILDFLVAEKALSKKCVRVCARCGQVSDVRACVCAAAKSVPRNVCVCVCVRCGQVR